jgi:hypothetical protein
MQRVRGSDIPKRCNIIKNPKPKFSLVELIYKISVPAVLSVAGTMIMVLSYFSMEGERQMEETRKLLLWLAHSIRIPSNSSTAVSMGPLACVRSHLSPD